MMKNKILVGIIALIFLISLTSAEVNVFQSVIIDNQTSSVTQHTSFQLEDTSSSLLLLHKYVPVNVIYSTQDLPFSLGDSRGFIENCTLNILHQANRYSSDNDLLTNLTLENETYVITNASSAPPITLNYRLLSRDYLSADFTCYYSNNQYLYFENILGGNVQIQIPAFACKGCTESSFQALTDANADIENRTTEATKFYVNFQNLVDKDFFIWLVVSWLIKIALIFIAVGLIFIAMYFLYIFFKSISEKIK
jgi:hypothetical protein